MLTLIARRAFASRPFRCALAFIAETGMRAPPGFVGHGSGSLGSSFWVLVVLIDGENWSEVWE